MAGFEIPLIGQPEKFFVTLGSVQYFLTFTWCDAPDAGWILDISDSNLNAIVSGIPLVTGVDLLGQYNYLGINGQLEIQTDGDITAIPTFTNLGLQSHLYFFPN